MNDDINLDMVFKNSIILDIVKASLSLLCSGFQMVYFRLDENRINECRKVGFDATTDARTWRANALYHT